MHGNRSSIAHAATVEGLSFHFIFHVKKKSCNHLMVGSRRIASNVPSGTLNIRKIETNFQQIIILRMNYQSDFFLHYSK